MTAAIIPADETKRLEALKRLEILDTPIEERFERVTRTAARTFGVPIVAVSLVDANRQWFKSCVGLTVRETSRDVSFCAHALLGGGALVVPDASLDPRFADNPLVTGEPYIRFYAGYPLAAADGSHVGTLCLIDRHPRNFEEADQRTLRDLAAWAESELTVIRAVQQALADREEQAAVLAHQATHDPLTGLPNRTLLLDRLQQAVAIGQRDQSSVALLVIDLDRFKDVNDTLGHQNGDLLITQVGARLAGALRASDTVARLGGDEFGILLPGADDQSAMRVARQLRQILETPFQLGDLAVAVEASIGIATFPSHGEDALTLLRRADVAMYVAKASHDGYTVYAAEHDHYSPERLGFVSALRQAIGDAQLFLQFQPQIDFRAGRTSGVEALVRWRLPDGTIVPPDQFIGIAERTGLIKPLTGWVLEAALRQARELSQAGHDLVMSVNLSARNLQTPELVEQITAMLQKYDVPPTQLELEVTESVRKADPAGAIEVLGRLKAIGLRLSIDDFGTGFSSLAYLKRLPVDAIKIDKSFVMGMATDESDSMIVRSTIGLAHNLGRTVIAEGVETAVIFKQLSEMGCDVGQGYYMSRPIPLSELMIWLKRSQWGSGRTHRVAGGPEQRAA
ncbi:MAG: EAL domain-containing protein [Nitrospirae bacterium]|nr:EAL domain-containing protein [Nitrospirota bacterium]